MTARPGVGLTARGSALLTAGLTALVCGIALGQRDLVRVAILLAAIPIVAAVVVNRSRVSVACSRSVHPTRVPPGVPIVVRIGLRNEALLPTGALMLEDHLTEPFAQRARFTLDSIRGREERSLAYQLPRAGRGSYRVGPMQMRLTDPFGLVERTRAFQSVSEVVILPQIDDLPDLPLPGGWDSAHQAGSHSVGTHGSDDASIRAYRYGDDLRKVHWRSTARLGSTMVRQEERPWHGRTTLLLDTRSLGHRHAARMHTGGSGPGAGQARAVPQPAALGNAADARTRDSFEWAVSATASIAAHLQRKGRALDVVVGPSRMSATRPGALLDQLAVVQRSDRSNLGESMALADANGQDATVIAVFGALDEASLRSVTLKHRPSGTALALLLDVASWTERGIGTPWPSGRGSPGAREATRRAELALTAAGWHVQRVDASSSTADAWAALLERRAGGSRVRAEQGAPAAQAAVAGASRAGHS